MVQNGERRRSGLEIRERKETPFNLPDRQRSDADITARQKHFIHSLAPEIDDSVLNQLGRRQASIVIDRLIISRENAGAPTAFRVGGTWVRRHGKPLVIAAIAILTALAGAFVVMAYLGLS